MNKKTEDPNLSEINSEEKLKNLESRIAEKEYYLNKIIKDILNREKILKTSEDDLPKEYRRLEDELRLRDKQIASLKEVVEKKSTPEFLASSTSNSTQKDKKIREMETYIEELKKLEINRQLELNEANSENEKLKKEIFDLRNKCDIKEIETKDMEHNISIEKSEYSRLLNKINELEMKIVKLTFDKNYLEDEKKRLLTEREENLNLISNQQNTVEKLMKEHEEEKLNCQNLLKEKIEFEMKINKMKNSLQEIKEKFEEELIKNEKVHSENNSELHKKIKSVEDSNMQLEKEMKLKNRANIKLEEIISKQEEKLNAITYKFSQIDELIKQKNYKLKENEDYGIRLVQIIEEQKKIIRGLNIQIENMNEKEQEKEIIYLKNNISMLRKEIELKSVQIETLQISNKKLQKESVKMKSKYNKMYELYHQKDPYGLNLKNITRNYEDSKDNINLNPTSVLPPIKYNGGRIHSSTPSEFSKLAQHNKNRKNNMKKEQAENQNGNENCDYIEKKNSAKNKNLINEDSKESKIENYKNDDAEDNNSNINEIQKLMKKILEEN